MGHWKRMSALGKGAKEVIFWRKPVFRLGYMMYSLKVSVHAGSFVFCFSNSVNIEGISQLLGGKQHHEN